MCTSTDFLVYSCLCLIAFCQSIIKNDDDDDDDDHDDQFSGNFPGKLTSPLQRGDAHDDVILVPSQH